MMGETCGLFGKGSLRSVTLQRSLENKLRDLVDVRGSPEYVLTWKRWDMPLPPPICRLRAWPRPISARDFSGWPTPKVTGGAYQKTRDGWALNLDGAARVAATLSGRPTPTARDWRSGSCSLTTLLHNRRPLNEVASWVALLRSGRSLKRSPGLTGLASALNPELSRWLMGFPREWLKCGPTETPSSRR